MPITRKVKNMLEIALGSALMYYFATEAFDIKKNQQKLSITQKHWIHDRIHLVECIESLS